jgi:ribosomal 30S subunit maturation factor RimM
MNEFTLMIHNRGWKVCEAIEHWGIANQTWLRMRKNEKQRNKLICMIRGLEDRNAT